MQPLGHAGCEPLDPSSPSLPPSLHPISFLSLCFCFLSVYSTQFQCPPFYSDCHPMLVRTVSGTNLGWLQVSQTCLLQVEAPLSTWAPPSPSLALPLFSIHCSHLAGVITGGCHPRPSPRLALLPSCDEQGALVPTPSAASTNTHSSIPSWGWRSRSPS